MNAMFFFPFVFIFFVFAPLAIGLVILYIVMQRRKEPSAKERIFCKSCSRMQNDDWIFCPYCGNDNSKYDMKSDEGFTPDEGVWSEYQNAHNEDVDSDN